MFYPVGDSAVCLDYEDSPLSCILVQEAVQRLRRYPIRHVTEWVPGMTTITFFYSPHQISYGDLCEYIQKTLAQETGADQPVQKRTIHIPICYGGEYGPDLEHVAAFHLQLIQ